MSREHELTNDCWCHPTVEIVPPEGGMSESDAKEIDRLGEMNARTIRRAARTPHEWDEWDIDPDNQPRRNLIDEVIRRRKKPQP